MMMISQVSRFGDILNVSPVSESSFLIEKAYRFGYKFVKLISDALIPPRRIGSSFSESNLGLN
jgi:hypothetical protein